MDPNKKAELLQKFKGLRLDIQLVAFELIREDEEAGFVDPPLSPELARILQEQSADA